MLQTTLRGQVSAIARVPDFSVPLAGSAALPR